MTLEEEKKLHQFETRVRQLVLKHKSVVEDNNKLRIMLDERDTQINALKNQVAEIEKQYATLKMAKMIEITSAETESAQKRIAKLIREVDKCIAMLNV